MSVSVLNTDANISAKTLLTAEGTATQTGLITFDRDPNPPFAVTANSSAVSNLNAALCAGLNDNETISGQWTFNNGIKFPGTQVASSDVNVLDDYEEGTFTPTIVSSGGGTPTYSTQVGRYIKVGRLVHISIHVALATKGTLAAGNVTIQGLPFTSQSLTSGESAFNVGYYANMTTATTFITGYMDNNSTTVNLRFNGAAAASIGIVTVGDIAATFDCIISGNYLAAL